MDIESARPLGIITLLLKAMEVLDYDRALKLFAADCQYINPPPIGAVAGPASVRAVLKPFFAPTIEK